MSQNLSSTRRSHEQTATSQPSFGNVSNVSSLVRRRPPICRCNEVTVLRTVSDLASVNRGKKFWGCRNFKDNKENGCNFFLWYDDDIVDERDLKIVRQKKKIVKLKDETWLLKEELCTTRKWLKTCIFCGCVSFGVNLVLLTIMLSSGRTNGSSSIYLDFNIDLLSGRIEEVKQKITKLCHS